MVTKSPSPALGAMFCLALFAIVPASNCKAKDLPADADGWRTLFDGKSLQGWKPSTDSPSSFSVVDGELKLSGNRAHLYYIGDDGKAEFKNFELKLKVKTMPNSNSGVYIHTRYQDQGWPSIGYECQVNSTQKDPKKTGSLYGVMNVFVDPPDGSGTDKFAPYLIYDEKKMIHMRVPKSLSKDGEWFDYYIKVQDKTITIKVNGRTTVQFTEPEGWGGRDPKKAGRKLSSGTIALQAHDPGSTVFYKDIQLKVLN